MCPSTFREGDALGVVGRNGSGKSTLLQIICGTLSPTAGTVQVNGRVAALLELGSGFNPELTGRENVHMNATILGLSAGEIEERFDDIVAFSEIAEFLDQPIKTYSSGMTLRLAFSVAVNVDADIIVIDEALAVGDARFQLKCAKAMDRLRENGKTLLFVSHDGGSIKRLCSEAILLERGRLLVRAAPNDTMNIYSKLIADERGAAAVEGDIRALAEARAAGKQGGLAPAGNVRAAERGLDERVCAPADERPVAHADHRRGVQLRERAGEDRIDRGHGRPCNPAYFVYDGRPDACRFVARGRRPRRCRIRSTPSSSRIFAARRFTAPTPFSRGNRPR